jgi:hypothetical protein
MVPYVIRNVGSVYGNVIKFSRPLNALGCRKHIHKVVSSKEIDINSTLENIVNFPVPVICRAVSEVLVVPKIGASTLSRAKLVQHTYLLTELSRS